jgi:DNA-3-methyladenine glycosylase
MRKLIKTKIHPAEVLSNTALRRKNTVALARWLIGKTLARRFPDGSVRRHIITETEAYHGETDLACHAAKGRTARTDVMYRAGGIWYIYLCYGVHEMLNLVTGPENFPSAILIRSVHGITGPGRLTKTLAITRALNGASACETGAHAQLWLEETPPPARRRAGVFTKQIQTTPRIGIAYAGPIWSAKPWRFVAGVIAEKSKLKKT